MSCDGRGRGVGALCGVTRGRGLDPRRVKPWRAARVSGLQLGARMWVTATAFAFESGASRRWGEGAERAGRWGLRCSEEG